MARSIEELRELQHLPLSLKIALTKDRIRQWVNEMPGVFVSFSGGKDSTVLLDIARSMYPDIPAVFFDTMEFPEMKEFVRTFENVEIIKPKMNFRQVVEKYGYPIISKEVSECVDGARRYLTKVMEQENALDRQTDRQTHRMHNSTASSADKASMRRMSGGGMTESTDGSEGSESLAHALQVKWETQGFSREMDNIRVQRLMGLNMKQGKLTAETTFSEKDRSAFACTRYQFFLDAPFEISSTCCRVMKKNPSHAYSKKTNRFPMTAEMAVESRLRTQKWLKSGCNGFDLAIPKSMPMAFWTEQDVLQYIYRNDLPICEIYGDVVVDYEKMGQIDGQMSMFKDDMPLKTTGARRTGCTICGFGCHLEKQSRFQLMEETHPKLCDWAFRGGEFDENGTWKPNSEGMGYWFVFEFINKRGGFDMYIPNREYYMEKYGTEETRRILGELPRHIGCQERGKTHERSLRHMQTP